MSETPTDIKATSDYVAELTAERDYLTAQLTTLAVSIRSAYTLDNRPAQTTWDARKVLVTFALDWQEAHETAPQPMDTSWQQIRDFKQQVTNLLSINQNKGETIAKLHSYLETSRAKNTELTAIILRLQDRVGVLSSELAEAKAALSACAPETDEVQS